GLGLGEAAGDLGVTAGDGADDLRGRDDVAVQGDRHLVQDGRVLVAGLPGRVVGVVQVRRERAEGRGALAVQRQVDLPLVGGGGQARVGRGDLGAPDLGHVERELAPLSGPGAAAGDDLNVRVVVGRGVLVADLGLPGLRVARLADQLVELLEHVLVHQARVAEGGAARGRTRAGARARAGRAARRRRGARGRTG